MDHSYYSNSNNSSNNDAGARGDSYPVGSRGRYNFSGNAPQHLYSDAYGDGDNSSNGENNSLAKNQLNSAADADTYAYANANANTSLFNGSGETGTGGSNFDDTNFLPSISMEGLDDYGDAGGLFNDFGSNSLRHLPEQYQQQQQQRHPPQQHAAPMYSQNRAPYQNQSYYTNGSAGHEPRYYQNHAMYSPVQPQPMAQTQSQVPSQELRPQNQEQYRHRSMYAPIPAPASATAPGLYTNYDENRIPTPAAFPTQKQPPQSQTAEVAPAPNIPHQNSNLVTSVGYSKPLPQNEAGADEPVIELSSDDEGGGDGQPTPKRARTTEDLTESPIPPPSGLSRPSQALVRNHFADALKNTTYANPPLQAPSTSYQLQKPVESLKSVVSQDLYGGASRPSNDYGNNGAASSQLPLSLSQGNENDNGKETLYEFQNKFFNDSVLRIGRIVHMPPKFEEFPIGFTATWSKILPDGFIKQSEVAENWSRHQPKAFKLSLMDVSYFTISGLPARHGQRPSSTKGLRQKIKQLSKDHGKAVFEKVNGSTEGRWKIPLGAYQAFFTYLDADPLVHVEGIPQHLLKVASLGRARKEKGYPSVKKLVSHGVPRGLAKALAPFQRGGVDFVIDKRGRALIADEMGLGKTVQAIASMSVYHRDWPIIILTPSSARYHWESEILHWLGKESVVNAKDSVAKNKFGDNNDDEGGDDSDHEATPFDKENSFQLLTCDQVKVLTNSKEPILPNGRIRVVICSYGLVPMLVDCGKIRPELFKCAIVDESHMLKNMATKRTSALVPFLQATNRCLLLSGTPAFAKPLELWPQLKILNGANGNDIWSDEKGFIHTYVKSENPSRRAELHTMLTGTVMIRRLKADILKTLPAKVREKALVNVCSESDKLKFHHYLMLLKEGKGRLGKLAQEHDAEISGEVTKYSMAVNLFTADEDEDPNSKRNVLNKLFLLTAQVKIPLLTDMVKKWIADPSKGKLCVFAHHLFVLDDIIRLTGMNNAPNSDRKYIRIDGATSPKERQAQIKKFQSDPTVRFAMLGITAAGVAVTLTACSTIWFSELFWTPALMIQAEDRCHRIGQLSRVKCLYFVARGTLDDLLWRLLEAKFRDLGEFVEGKEKMKMVVHRTYKGLQELNTMFDEADVSDDEDVKASGDAAAATEPKETDFFMLNGLEMDFEEMGKEEMKMLTKDDDDDDIVIETLADASEVQEEVQGSTEEEAIMLSDDEDGGNTTYKNQVEKPLLSPLVTPAGTLNPNGAMPNCRIYSMMFSGQSYGVKTLVCENRVIVGNRTKYCSQIKPNIGDILVAINGQQLPFTPDISPVVHFLKNCMTQPPVQLVFAEDPEFNAFFQKRMEAIVAEKRAQREAAAVAAASEPVIELLDD